MIKRKKDLRNDNIVCEESVEPPNIDGDISACNDEKPESSKDFENADPNPISGDELEHSEQESVSSDDVEHNEPKPVSRNVARRVKSKPVKGKKSKIKATPISIEGRRAVVVSQRDKASKLSKLSAIWTLLSTAYAIVTTCLFVSRDWVSATVSYVLIAILSVYILAFIGLVVFVIRDPKRGAKTTKTYKKVLMIYKAFINVVFLILTAVSMAGMAANSMSVGKWILFVLTFIVAVVQLGLKLTLFISGLIRRRLVKKFKVTIENYKDGTKKKRTVRDVMIEKKYKDKD